MISEDKNSLKPRPWSGFLITTNMRVYLSIIIVFSALLVACGDIVQDKAEQTIATSIESAKQLYGEAQGTTYSIVYFGDSVPKVEVDSILHQIDLSLSNWESESLIRALNESDTTAVVFDDYHGFFTDMIRYSREVYSSTDGAFDPSVYPLVQLWGFGLKNRTTVEPNDVEALMPLIGFDFDNVRLSRFDDRNTMDPKRILVKGDTAVQLDFNAIAQGYSVDVLADFLNAKGIDAYLIELGGEMIGKGNKPNGDSWKVGIDRPLFDAKERELQATISLSNEAIATSGNYRKYYEVNGARYSHTLDPKTGYPVKHTLLSATVVASSCWKADAYATAFMVMGMERSKAFLEAHPNLGLKAYFIADEGGSFQTFATPGLSKTLTELN